VKRLAIYLMAGADTPVLAEAAVDGGADLVEVGIPFSDPLADGPVIRAAAERALAAGMRTERCLEVLAETRRRVEVPLVPMTYASVLEAYGWDRFVAHARGCGAASLIVADLPADARPRLRRVHLVAPTSPPDRIRLAAGRTDGTSPRRGSMDFGLPAHSRSTATARVRSTLFDHHRTDRAEGSTALGRCGSIPIERDARPAVRRT
jgi:tryptophan synthase alpha subunit